MTTEALPIEGGISRSTIFVWLNAGATALTIFAFPFLPGILVDRPDHTPASDRRLRPR